MEEVQMQIKQWIPWTMVVGRAALGPVVVLGERCGWSGSVLATLVLTALLSDIFDGVLARRWKTDTAALRLSDTLADTAFYLCVAAAIGFGMPAMRHEYRSGVLLVLGCEAVHFAVDFAKFGRPASYHSYLAKTWGLVLAVAVVVTFATQHTSIWMSAAVALGVLSNAETLAMSLILPVWRRDVKTLAVAWRMRTVVLRKDLLRKQVEANRAVAAPIGLALLLTLGMLGSPDVQAQSLQHVTYVGGTVLQGNRIDGKLSIGTNDTLEFAAASKLVIPYDHVISYESTSRKVVHVGLLTEGIWKLVAPWPEAKQLSLSYRDADEHTQVVVLEMSRGDEALLVEVLKARVPRGTFLRPVPPLQPPLGQNEKSVAP
jgi:CDP-diacylglycerol--glycerol-3-phosphate 3-phosphatidyltransferase